MQAKHYFFLGHSYRATASVSLVLAIFSVLFACGGGGGSSTNPNNELWCGSSVGTTRTCRINKGTISGVTLVQKYTDAACDQGRTWTSGPDFVQVADGCDATFQLTGSNIEIPTSYLPSSRTSSLSSTANMKQVDVVCESQAKAKAECKMPITGTTSTNNATGTITVTSVSVKTPISTTECVENENWYYDASSLLITVINGCRAKFLVKYRTN